MEQEYFYIPISSLNFTNLLSSDSLSPASFYMKRGYGFRRFEKTASNPFDNLILAYSKPVEEPIRKTGREEFLLNLRVPVQSLNDADQIEKGNFKILTIENSLHFNPFVCELVFKNDEERKRVFAQGMKSLEAKFISYYQQNAKLLSDLDDDSLSWTEDILESVSEGKFSYQEIEKDQRINKIKGVIYGIASGMLSSGSPETNAVKQFVQEFNNEFSSILNQLSTVGSGTKKGSVSMEQLRPALERLDKLSERIITLTRALEESNELEMVASVIQAPTQEVEKWKLYRPGKGKSVYDLVLTYLQDDFLELLPLQNIFDYLIHRIRIVSRYKSPSDYKQLQETYSNVRHDLTARVASFTRQESDQNVLEYIPIRIDADYFLANANLENLTNLEKETFIATINEIISSPETSSSDEIAQRRKSIVEKLGQKLKSIDEKGFDKNGDLEYLRRLWKSIQTVGTGFRIDEGKNTVLRVLATFTNKYVEFEKYQDFLVKNQLINKDVAYAIWGGAYGYANLSKLLVEPLERNEFSARVVFDFLESSLGVNNTYSRSDSSKTGKENEETPAEYVWDFPQEPSIEEMSYTQEKPSDEESEVPSLSSELESLFMANNQLSKHREWLEYSLKKLKVIMNTGRLEETIEGRLSDFHQELTKKGGPKGFGSKKAELVVELLKKCLND